MTGPIKPKNGFIPFKGSGGWGTQPAGPTPLGGQIRDTFKVDAFGNVTGGHSTLQIPGGQKKKLPWK